MIEQRSSTSRPETSLPLSSETAAQRTRRPAIGPLVVIAVAIALLVIGKATTPQFVTGSNVLTILRATSLTAIVALGLTFVTISGNYFSLSVAQTAVVASVLYASIGSSGGFVMGVIVALAACTLLGVAQGAIVGLGANPVVVTFATGATVIGGVLVATHGNRVELHASGVATQLGQSSPLGVPTQTWAFVICAVACYLVLERTTLGRRTKLVGANRDTAVASGLNVMRTVITVFAISALAAAIAGVLTAAQFGVADSTQFTGTDINAIAAVLVGGTSIRGGEGSVQRTCMGAVFIAMLSNLLQVRGYSTGIQLTFIGVAVVIAVSAYGLVKKRTT